jgi:hypothetical protein
LLLKGSWYRQCRWRLGLHFAREGVNILVFGFRTEEGILLAKEGTEAVWAR